MKKALSLAGLILVLVAASPALGRTWTDVNGRKIEAEILSVEGEKVILQFNGRKVPLALTKLSKEDQEFVESWKKETSGKPTADKANPAADLTLCGTPLRPGGGVMIVEEPLSEKALKAFPKGEGRPKNLKIAIALPSGFDPAKPQRVLWISAAINNDEQRKGGNIRMAGGYAKTANAAGWVVVAADTDLGNPRAEDDQEGDSRDLAVHTNAIQAMAKAWPGFTSWDFVCCGFSGGAKASFFRAGQLLASDLKVIGLYLGGCNGDLTQEAQAETSMRKRDLKRIKVFVNTGKSDTTATPEHAEKIKDSMESNGYGEVKIELYEGAHQLNQGGVKTALEWFLKSEE